MNKNVIHLQGMIFYGYHGVMPQEQELGQKFIVDLDIIHQRATGRADDIQDTINYAEVFSIVENCVTQERYLLIETLAERIADLILQGFNCEQVKVEVHKPQAPIPGIFQDVSVEIIREKKA